MAKDVCVLCGVETPYDYETHVDLRLGYIEGAGQLCAKCYRKVEDIPIPRKVIKDTPNDQELGSRVRQIYHQKYKNG